MNAARNNFLRNLLVGLAGLLTIPPVEAADAVDFTGTWTIEVKIGEARATTTLTLDHSGDRYRGSSGPLDDGGYFPLEYTGTLHGSHLRLVVTAAPLFADPVGSVTLERSGSKLHGGGPLSGQPATLTSLRPEDNHPVAKTYDFQPRRYFTTLSAVNLPALR